MSSAAPCVDAAASASPARPRAMTAEEFLAYLTSHPATRTLAQPLAEAVRDARLAA